MDENQPSGSLAATTTSQPSRKTALGRTIAMVCFAVVVVASVAPFLVLVAVVIAGLALWMMRRTPRIASHRRALIVGGLACGAAAMLGAFIHRVSQEAEREDEQRVHAEAAKRSAEEQEQQRQATLKTEKARADLNSEVKKLVSATSPSVRAEAYRRLRVAYEAASAASAADLVAPVRQTLSGLDDVDKQIVATEAAVPLPEVPDKPVYEKPDYVRDEPLNGEDRELVGREAVQMFRDVDREYQASYREEVAAARKEYQEKQREYAEALRHRRKAEAEAPRIEKARRAERERLLAQRERLIDALATGLGAISGLK